MHASCTPTHHALAPESKWQAVIVSPGGAVLRSEAAMGAHFFALVASRCGEQPASVRFDRFCAWAAQQHDESRERATLHGAGGTLVSVDDAGEADDAAATVSESEYATHQPCFKPRSMAQDC